MNKSVPADERPRSHRESERGYLQALGQRVRVARARRGMSRKILSQQSGVSERYLAQLESGAGNVSIVLLHQIAQSMSIPIADLVSDAPERPVDYTLTLQILERLNPEQLGEARRLLLDRFGVGAQAARRRIALIGLRGAGKSSLGQDLAERLGVPFVELDREIERASGMELREVFDLAGQAGFRRWERRCLEDVVARYEAAVIATGGSLVTEPATFDLLLSSCRTIWLQAAPAEHMKRVMEQGDFRPMADNREAMDDLKAILAGRGALYAKADDTLDTSGRTFEESLEALVALTAAG